MSRRRGDRVNPLIELLILAGSGPVGTAAKRDWPHGPQRAVACTASALHEALAAPAAAPDVEAVLCLDAALPLPDPGLLARLLAGPADAWHAGLRLGLEGQPRMLDHVSPLWMLNAPLDHSIETTSWRVSMRALLARVAVFDQLGGPGPAFDTLAGAGLELGLRWIRAGALMRHVPDLVPDSSAPDELPTDADGIRLIGSHYGRLWAGWALQRALVTREVGVAGATSLGRLVRASSAAPGAHYIPAHRAAGSVDRTVSVVIPTLDRYAYLEPLLHQLAAQTVVPHQVIVTDQTPTDRRRHDLTDIEPELHVTVIGLPFPGQSTARNAALRQATGELVLFIDDDDEIGHDLLAEHLRRLIDGVDASCGGVDDATAGPPPVGFRHRRASDVFPTNNSMMRRVALERTGLFDPAFDGLPMEDHDLGMRLHQAGALLVYDPSVLVFHHHAPVGGLRVHGTRAITRASSRRSLTERNLPTVTELYLGHRYLTGRQRHEGRAVRLLSTLSGDGPTLRRLGRAAIQVALLPDTVRTMRRADRAAVALAATHLGVPPLGPESEN